MRRRVFWKRCGRRSRCSLLDDCTRALGNCRSGTTSRSRSTELIVGRPRSMAFPPMRTRKEVVVDADWREAEQLLPDSGERALNIAGGRREGIRQFRARREPVGCRNNGSVRRRNDGRAHIGLHGRSCLWRAHDLMQPRGQRPTQRKASITPYFATPNAGSRPAGLSAAGPRTANDRGQTNYDTSTA